MSSSVSIATPVRRPRPSAGRRSPGRCRQVEAISGPGAVLEQVLVASFSSGGQCSLVLSHRHCACGTSPWMPRVNGSPARESRFSCRSARCRALISIPCLNGGIVRPTICATESPVVSLPRGHCAHTPRVGPRGGAARSPSTTPLLPPPGPRRSGGRGAMDVDHVAGGGSAEQRPVSCALPSPARSPPAARADRGVIATPRLRCRRDGGRAGAVERFRRRTPTSPRPGRSELLPRACR